MPSWLAAFLILCCPGSPTFPFLRRGLWGNHESDIGVLVSGNRKCNTLHMPDGILEKDSVASMLTLDPPVSLRHGTSIQHSAIHFKMTDPKEAAISHV